MRRSHIAALAVIAAVTACSVSDSTVGPRPLEQARSLSVSIPPTSNTPCNVHWATGVNGSWFDPAKWSPAGVPGSSSSVCIDAAGTYTVTLDAPVDSVPTPALAISLGGTGAAPTLTLSGDHERVNVSEGVVIASGGTILFNSGQGNTLTAVGTITNAGLLKVAAPCGGCGGAAISADLINSGTIQITGGPKLTLSKVNGQYQNTGNMTFGGFIDIPATAGNAVFSQEAGLYGGASNSETFTMRSGTFYLRGGKIRSRANLLPIVLLDGASLVIDSTATDSATIGVRGKTDAVPTITGNYPPLMTLWIAGASNGGNGTVELMGNPVNRGTMRVSFFVDVFAGISVTGSGRLTNIGTINNTDANRDTLFYSIDLTNNGTINAVGQSSIVLRKAGGSYENSGLIDLQAGISVLSIESGGTFTNTSPGTITNGGVVVDGNSHLRGNGTLTTIVTPQNGGAIDPGTSPGLFTFKQFRMPSTGLLNIELGGLTPVTEYDRLVVTELAGFGGTLNVSEINGFQAGLCGQVFDVAYAPSGAAGMFPVINGLNPGPGRMLRPIMVGQTSTTPAIIRLVGFDPNVKVCAGPPSVSLSEGGPSLQYAVALRDAPTSTVIVKAVGDAQVSAPDSAVFTTSNWQTPQILNVTAIDDAVYEGTHTGVVTHTVRSIDAAYNGTAAGSITATITDNDAPPLVPTTVDVTIDSSSIEVGHTAHASAVVRDQNGNVMAGEAVVWSSNTPSFASVSASGVVTAVAAGTAVIKATDGSASGTASVTVTAPPPPPPVVTTISVSIDSTSLQEGHTAQASATVRDQYGAVMSGQTITWSTDTPLRVSVSNAGVVTAISAGSASIRATVGSVSNTASLTITSPPPPPPVVTTITVSIDSSSLQVGHTAQATGTVRDQYGAVMSGQSVTWSSNTPSFASVSAAGVVTAVAEGSAVIKATIGSVFGTASVTITSPPPPPPVVTTVTVAIDSASLQVGHTAHATAEVRDQYGAVMNGQTITWSSDTPLLAAVSTSGVVTGIAEGAASIRATVGAVSNTASLAITAPPPAPPVATTITVSVDSASLQVGHSAQATAVVRDQNGALMSGQTITWSSEAPLLASVSSTGVVTAVAQGTAVIRATVGALFDTTTVNITAPASSSVPASVSVSIDSASLQVGHTAQATATVRDQFGNVMSDEPVRWVVLGTQASISPSGVITALEVGYPSIGAVVRDRIADFEVLVVTAAPSGPASPIRYTVTITFDSASLHVGSATQATGIVRDLNGNAIPSAAIQRWSSLTPSIVSVSSTGLVTALRAGSGTIQATSVCVAESCVIGSGVPNPTGTANMQVLSYTPPVPRRIEIVLPPMSEGDTAIVTANVYDQFGALMHNQPVVWSAETPQVLTISNRLCAASSSCVLARAIRSGWGRVSATLGNLSARNQIYVNAGFPKAFVGSVSRSQSYTITFYPGCSWNVWVENIQMTSDWRSNGQGQTTATLRAEGCQISPWSSSQRFTFSTLSETGTTQLSGSAPQWYGAKFQMEKVSKTGMTGYLIFQFFNFGNRSFDIPVKITLQ